MKLAILKKIENGHFGKKFKLESGNPVLQNLATLFYKIWQPCFVEIGHFEKSWNQHFWKKFKLESGNPVLQNQATLFHKQKKINLSTRMEIMLLAQCNNTPLCKTCKINSNGTNGSPVK